MAVIVRKLAKQEALGVRHSHVGDRFQLLAIIDAKIARERLLQAYDIHLKALGEAHPRVGSDLILLAKQHDTDDIDTALYYSDLAVNVFCHSAVDGTQIVVSILNDMAVLHLARNETTIAMELFHNALDLYHHFYQQQMEDYDESYSHHRQKLDPIQLETVQVHWNIAKCHVVTKDFTTAIASFLVA
jgi:hypothetical protein